MKLLKLNYKKHKEKNNLLRIILIFIILSLNIIICLYYYDDLFIDHNLRKIKDYKTKLLNSLPYILIINLFIILIQLLHLLL
jgi:hypothetical protein